MNPAPMHWEKAARINCKRCGSRASNLYRPVGSQNDSAAIARVQRAHRPRSRSYSAAKEYACWWLENRPNEPERRVHLHSPVARERRMRGNDGEDGSVPPIHEI